MRGLVFAVFGMAGASAFAQGGNVTAFNPYSGVGLPGGPPASYGPQAAYPIVDTVGPAGGPAFNPWQSAAPMPSAGSVVGAFVPGQQVMGVGAGPAAGAAPTYTYSSPGSNLPPPPRHVGSRLVAIPERGDARIPRNLLYSTPPAAAPVAVSAPAPAVAPAPPPPAAAAANPTPTPAARTAPPVIAARPAPTSAPAPAPPPAAAPARQPAAERAPAPAVPGQAVAVTTAPSAGPAFKGSTAASIPFTAQSADLSDVAKSELDRVAKNITDKSLRQVELRAYASGDAPESRKIALARALVVRSYLIDRGVKTRIEVGGFAGADGERVDILVPNS